MTETRQSALFALSILTFVAALGALFVGFQILDQCRANNTAIATLRAQVGELRVDLHETKAALEGSCLGEENEVLRARAETAERRARL